MTDSVETISTQLKTELRNKIVEAATQQTWGKWCKNIIKCKGNYDAIFRHEYLLIITNEKKISEGDNMMCPVMAY